MGIQQWCFSFKGRVARREFWLWICVWFVSMTLIFFLASHHWLKTQSAAFLLVGLLWPTSAVWVKRLHDRNKSGWWALLLVLAWLLGSGNWQMLPTFWQWGVGRFMPLFIILMMLIDCGVFVGTSGDNRYGSRPEPLSLRHFRLSRLK